DSGGDLVEVEGVIEILQFVDELIPLVDADQHGDNASVFADGYLFLTEPGEDFVFSPAELQK
ncbi:MAG TPA: hypothetical protein VER55_08600, partial [Ardenticatenaceae bacterium]|nr:hypothetical protein [Ardenticatenaceae bacterium]